MDRTLNFDTARDLLLGCVSPVTTEYVPLAESAGRILADDLCASENVPPFDRSPYDGYALCASDTEGASEDYPVTFQILEEVPAGAVPTIPVTSMTATKILTGAPIPKGADTVIPYELTHFTKETVTIFAPLLSGSNIVRTGEDICKGQLLAGKGTLIDTGLMGTLASQGVSSPLVYRHPLVGIISTGNEVVEINEPLASGKIRNSNRYTLAAALETIGCDSFYLGIAGDSPEEIAALITKGLSQCDALLLTGGVSVGDYDFTPVAMERAGVEIITHGINIKPGMACAYGVKNGKLVCGLSGNPASSLTNFYAVAQPALRKLTGRNDFLPEEITVTLKNEFKKKSLATRLLRGKLELSDGTVTLVCPKDQGNVVLSSTIGCNAMGIVPAGSGPLAAGTKLKGFII